MLVCMSKRHGQPSSPSPPESGYSVPALSALWDSEGSLGRRSQNQIIDTKGGVLIGSAFSIECPHVVYGNIDPKQLHSGIIIQSV